MAPPFHSPNRHHVQGRRARLALAVTGLLLLVAGGLGLHQRRAGAVVVHGLGFNATVLGWTSWYGSYQLPSVGTAWCIDHGLHAPDTTYAYGPTEVDRPAATTTAMAWLLAAHGAVSQPTDAAAVMLVLHDLMGASYPYGRLDLGTLQVQNLAGFNGQEASVLSQARAWKAEALAHAGLRGPVALRLTRAASQPGTGPPAGVVATVTDSTGTALSGIGVTIAGLGVPGGHVTLATDARGQARIALSSPPVSGHVTAQATVPDLHLAAFSSGPSAQRVARPSHTAAADSLSWTPPPPGTLELRKVDKRSGASLAGAVLVVAPDANHDGHADGPTRRITTSETPTPIADLPPGNYVVSEVTAPAGYRADPSPQQVEITSGRVATVTLADEALMASINATKVDGVTGTTLPGAVYDLYQRHEVASDGAPPHQPPADAAVPPPDGTPDDAAQLPNMQWVARATSDAQGLLAWPPQSLGFVYCAREVTAPPGYDTQPALICTDGALASEAPVILTVVDNTTTTSTPPTSAPPRAAPSTTTTTSAPATTVPATTVPTTSAPTTVTAPHPRPPTPRPPSNLAYTGAPTRQWASVGIGLLLLGVAALASRRRRPPV